MEWIQWNTKKYLTKSIMVATCTCMHRRTRRGGGGGLGGCSPPWNLSNSHIRAKNQVIFGQNHLIFGQAMEEIFGQLTSAPLNETGPVRLCMYVFSTVA